MQIQKINCSNNILAIQKETPEPSKTANMNFCGTKSINNDVSKIPMSVIRKNTASSRQQLLEPVESEEEYYFRLRMAEKYEKPYKEFFSVPYIDFSGYSDMDFKLRGLIPYCGVSDISDEINCWLTGRTRKGKYILPDDKMANIVKVLDYSLNELDKKYGKYSGTVFRTGFFNPVTDKQFYSTSSFPEGAVKHSNIHLKNNKYSIINVKNGHKIEDFQKNCDNDTIREFASEEGEILLDRTQKFRKKAVKEYTQADIENIKKLTEEIKHLSQNYADSSKDINSVLKNISVWEEI